MAVSAEYSWRITLTLTLDGAAENCTETHRCACSSCRMDVACIGACGLSPCIMINGQVEAKLTPKKVTDLLRKAGNDN